jgi:ABC-2 type transport system ATP-binding protein
MITKKRAAMPSTPGMGTPGLVVETVGLSKRFADRVAVDGVDLSIPRGVAFGYLGPNGAGKTTLIRVLLGLTPATSGTIWLLGQPVPARREQALARIGAIVEEPRFHGFLTGRENLEVVAAARGSAAFAHIEGALARAGLSERADEKVKGYSLGMRQRLGVARSLLADPELLILDEPTNGLDPAGVLEFREMVRGLVGEGRTVIISSHLLGEVERICEMVAIVDRGRIVAQGPIQKVAGLRRKTILISTDADEDARSLISRHSAVSVVIPDGDGDGLEVCLKPDHDSARTAGELNADLVRAKIAVRRLQPVDASLEQRFLEITSSLGDDQ